MRVRRERKLIEIICIDCCKTYTAQSRAAKRCPECNLKHRREYRQEYAEANKKEQIEIQNKFKKPMYKPKPMSQILKEMEIYNKEHKTRLSYGQYVALVDK